MILNIIKSLQRTALELTSYQDDFLTTAIIEYGLKENQSFGLNLSYKQNSFSSSKSSFTSPAKIVEFFYKYCMFQSNHHILSVQPKFIINNNYKNNAEIYSELSLFFGTSYNIRKNEFFIEMGLNNINGIYGNYRKKKEYSVSISEGIKMPKGWMLLHYTKYNFRNDANPVYKTTLYQQLSIAKEVNLGNMKNELTIQVGYFKDQSLKRRRYKITGLVFSIWLEI